MEPQFLTSTLWGEVGRADPQERLSEAAPADQSAMRLRRTAPSEQGRGRAD
ncbi:hypothetical protein [Paenibacillus terrae]|uniref:hypothetical protein n=1 Tax=Paenibacillus terrae TaxID=159743 RepID=UPI000ABC67C6|nr:hypothetical protein [Paenibacillus terrae]